MAALWSVAGVFAVTGGLIWAWVAFGLTVRILRSGRVVRRLETRELLPYTLLAKYRFLGGLGALAAKMGVRSSTHVPKEIVDAYRSIELDDMKQLRDIFVEMDTL